MEKTFPTDTINFYSRPCGRGDVVSYTYKIQSSYISTHAPAGGATSSRNGRSSARTVFLLTPLREGRPWSASSVKKKSQFLLTPLREGRPSESAKTEDDAQFLLTPLREGRRSRNGRSSARTVFLLTPLREGRRCGKKQEARRNRFLLTPLREGRPHLVFPGFCSSESFLLTPLREGRPGAEKNRKRGETDFYSRPCGRGDCNFPQVRHEVLRQIAER